MTRVAMGVVATLAMLGVSVLFTSRETAEVAMIVAIGLSVSIVIGGGVFALWPQREPHRE